MLGCGFMGDSKVIIYKSLYENIEFKFGQLWYRPFDMFFEKIEKPKDNYTGPRFIKN